MANALGTLFQDIANAIRGKTGNNSTMKPIEFPQQIESIETGGGTLTDVIDSYLDKINGEVVGGVIVTFVGLNGEVLLKKSVEPDSDCPDPVETGKINNPSTSDKYKTYTFIGWSLAENGEVDTEALNAVTSDRTVYAVFTEEYIYIARGTDGDAIVWTIDPDYVLRFTGTGDMTNWSSSINNPWDAHINKVREIIIGEGITSVGAYAFKGHYHASSVTLPETIRVIHDGAFNLCINLVSITIPSNVWRIGSQALNTTVLTSAVFSRTKGWTQFDEVVPESTIADPSAAAALLSSNLYTAAEMINVDIKPK